MTITEDRAADAPDAPTPEIGKARARKDAANASQSEGANA